jgi:hypothetical protein
VTYKFYSNNVGAETKKKGRMTSVADLRAEKTQQRKGEKKSYAGKKTEGRGAWQSRETRSTTTARQNRTGTGRERAADGIYVD